MSDITVNVTNSGAANVSVSSAATVNTTVGSGGDVSVAIGAISPGDATVVSGTVQVGKVTTLAPGSNVTINNSGTAFSAVLDFGIPGATADASLLSSGIVPDARLGSNIPRLVNNLVQAVNLPSYVDDVVDVGGTLPESGDTGKIYVVSTGANANKIYRWSGSTFIEISPSPGTTDAVPEGSANLYFTNVRAAAAAPVQSVAGRTGAVTLAASDVGLGSVDNTSDANKPVSTAQASADSAVQSFAVQRANHTGTQTASTISDFATESAKYGPVVSVAGRTGAVEVAPGTNISITASGQTITVASTAIGKNDAIDCGFFYGVSTPTIVITQHPANQTASSGAASFSVSAYVTHDGTPSYQWQKKDPSGMTWTQRTLPSADWTSVAYGNGVFVAVSNGVGGGNGNIAATSTDGATWTQRTLPTSREWKSVAFGNGTFVAVTLGSDAATSTDGVTWTQRTLPSGVQWSSVAYGNGTFVAITDGTISGSGNVAATSTDGSSWTQRTLPASARWSSVTYGNGKFVAVSLSNSDIAATSPDGVTWTQRTLPTSREWQSVAFGNGVFVAIDSLGSFAATSADGITWAQASMPLSGWTYVTYADDAFFAVAKTGAGANIVAKSTDGITWVQRSLPATSRWCGVAYGGGVFVAISTNISGASTIAASSVGSSVFTNIANATASVLSLSGLSKAADDGDQYRVVVSSAIAASVTSNAATLTVP
jgi:hypothetical protein